MPALSEGDPLVSVVAPVYNADAYVRASVERLLAQSYSNFEVIVVDDKSTDATLAEIGRLPPDPRLRLVAAPRNLGVAGARNLALRHARGDYVWFVDIDDTWSTDFLRTVVPVALRTRADATFCSARFVFGTALGRSEYVVRYKKEELLTGARATEATLLGTGALWNKLIRRDRIGDSPFPPLKSKSDHAGLLAMLPRFQRVATLPDALYTYIQRAGSISNGGVREPENFLALLPIAQQSLDFLEQSPHVMRLRSRFRCMIVARAIREDWRFGNGDLPRVARMAGLIRWREILVVRPREIRTIVTCVGAKIAPRVAMRTFRWLGRSRWTQQGTAR